MPAPMKRSEGLTIFRREYVIETELQPRDPFYGRAADEPMPLRNE